VIPNDEHGWHNTCSTPMIVKMSLLQLEYERHYDLVIGPLAYPRQP
jgi:hypothetical protein